MWSVWDKKSEINGFSAEFVLSRNQHLVNEETIYIKTVGGRTSRIEGKSVLADGYNIDPALSDEAFIAAYEAKLADPDPKPATDGGDTEV